MNIALFGGTFDPVHSGHLRAAKEAARKFHLDQVLFVTCGNPAHKPHGGLTPFSHRAAMVALACGGDPRLVPSLLEAPSDSRIHYSVDTAAAARKLLAPSDHLFSLLGLDSFLDLPNWKQYRRLFDLVDFIVVSRPGFGGDKLLGAIPEEIRPAASAATGRGDKIELGTTTVHLLRHIEMAVASRDIREAVKQGRKVTGLVPKLVEEYIVKEGLYSPRKASRIR